MIKTKKDLEYYLAEDSKVYGKTPPSTLKEWFVNWLFPDAHVEYMRTLRYLEYWTNLAGGGGGGGK